MSVPKPKICKGGGAKLVFAIYYGCLVPEPAAAVSQHKLPPSPAITRLSRW